MAKQRVNVRLSEEAIVLLDELCKKELRDRSNMVEVLILREDERQKLTTETEEQAQQG